VLNELCTPQAVVYSMPAYNISCMLPNIVVFRS